MAKEKKEPAKPSTAWQGTYGDMITLMLCFFVMLYDPSEVDVTQLEQISSSISIQTDALDTPTPTGGRSLTAGRLADLGNTIGSEQGGKRPVVIIQNDTGNIFSTTTLIMPLSKKTHKNPFQPTHTLIKKSRVNGLREDSIVLGEQLRVISSQRILFKIGNIAKEEERNAIRKAYEANFGE